MRILITGCEGQLGLALQQTLEGEELLCMDLPEHDILDGPQLRSSVSDFQPQVVLHCAAMTDVDGCERDQDAAFRVNALGTHNVALACQDVGADLVAISTNEVFDGTQSEPYLEWDRPNPVAAYGRSKWAGEQSVQMLLNRFYIVRTAWLFAQSGQTFPFKILRAAEKRGELSVVTDEISNPTYAPDTAAAIARLIETDHFGIYHFTNSGFCSRHEFAREALRLAGLGQVPITPIAASEWPRLSTPPLRAVLANTAGTELGITPRPWQEALAAYFEEEVSAGQLETP